MLCFYSSDNDNQKDTTFPKERMTQDNKCTIVMNADVVKLLIRITDQKSLPSCHKLFRSPTPDDLRECLHKYAEENFSCMIVYSSIKENR